MRRINTDDFLKQLFAIFLPVILVSCVLTDREEPGIPDVSYVDYITYQSVYALEKLHRIKIDDIDSLENNIERSLVTDAKIFIQILESGKLSEKDEAEIYSVLRLLSVMNEKYEIQLWRNDQELQAIFHKVQETDSKHIEQLRCFNWNKPMWVETDGCS